MGVTLEGQNLIIGLDEFEAKVAERAMPLVESFIAFQIKVMLRIIFHILQTDRKTFRDYRNRIEAGEDPHLVTQALMDQIREYIVNNPNIMKMLDSSPSFDEWENLLPSKEE